MWQQVKQAWGTFWYWAGIAVLALVVLTGWFGPSHTPTEGAKCGPHHQWVYERGFRGVDGPELSCEDTGIGL